MQRRAVLSGLAALPFATPLAATSPTRSFRIGTTRWPPDLTLKALGQVENFLNTQADMAAPMILGGVPWVDAAAEAPFSLRLSSELGWRAPKGHPVLLSLGALDMARSGLAPLYATTDNLPLPPEWAGRAFDDPEVIRAYSAFCVRAADTMRPDWLAIGIEVNLLLQFAPDLWPAYKRLHRATYEAVKTAFPDMPVVLSIAAQTFMGMADDADAAVQARGMAELMSHTDLVAYSIYPHLSSDVPDPIPAGFYDPLSNFAARFGKPAAISESGTASDPVWWGWWRIPGSDERQVQATEALFQTARDGGYSFVVNFTSHDYPALLKHIPAEARDLAGLWVSTGIVDGNGDDKAVTPLWRNTLAQPFG